MEVKIYNFIIFTAKCVQRPLGHVEPQRLPKKSCALLLALRSSYSPTVFSPRHLDIQLKILLLAYCSHLWKTSFSIIESVNWSFSFTSVLCFYLNTFWFFPFQCSEPTSSTISSCTSAGTSCSVRSGSSTFSSTSTLDFSNCGSVDEDWEISGRSSPVFSSTPKEKGQPKQDGCTPPVNVRLLRDYIFDFFSIYIPNYLTFVVVMDTEKIISHFQILWTKYIEIYRAEVSY